MLESPESPCLSTTPVHMALNRHVWLIKAPPTSSDDVYKEALGKEGFSVRYIPAIIETFDTRDLENLLSDRLNSWDGVIITSKRGAQGWLRAVKNVRDGSKGSGELARPIEQEDHN